MRVLVVDDEPLARRRLKALLHDEPDVEVVAECGDGPSAVAMVRERRPDLILLDVQMPGMSGFDVIADLGAAACPPVVFVTAYDRYAVKAFEVHAVDYLLKPFDRRRLCTALARARRLIESPDDLARRLEALIGTLGRPPTLERIAVKTQGRVYFVTIDEIDWIEAAGHYLALHVGRDTHLVRETMSGMEGRLDPARFARVHRSAIVNLSRIQELRPSFHGEYDILLKGGARLASGRAYSERLQKLVS